MVQTMCNTHTSHVEVICQCVELAEAGAQMIRPHASHLHQVNSIAEPFASAENGIEVPIAADVHFA